MRTILWILLGAVAMFVVLKIISKKAPSGASDSEVNARLLDLAGTQQVYNLLLTNEFRELVKTKEFTSFVNTLANEQIKILAKTLAL